MAEYDNKVALGTSITQLVTLIKNALTGKQNRLTAGSGIDITNDVISSTGGGSSLPTDPSTDGSYKLVNTVETDSGTQEQTGTLSWEEDTEYTAGDGIKINNGVITSCMPFGSPYMSLFGINSGGTTANLSTFVSQLKLGEVSIYGISPMQPYELKTKLNLTGIIKVSEDGSVQYITSFALAPSEWSTWTDARWILINRNPNGNWLVWAKNFQALSAWLSRRCYVSSSALTATDVYTAINELATTRLADSLSSTADTPITNNTIIWQYE